MKNDPAFKLVCAAILAGVIVCAAHAAPRCNRTNPAASGQAGRTVAAAHANGALFR